MWISFSLDFPVSLSSLSVERWCHCLFAWLLWSAISVRWRAVAQGVGQWWLRVDGLRTCPCVDCLFVCHARPVAHSARCPNKALSTMLLYLNSGLVAMTVLAILKELWHHSTHGSGALRWGTAYCCSCRSCTLFAPLSRGSWGRIAPYPHNLLVR